MSRGLGRRQLEVLTIVAGDSRSQAYGVAADIANPNTPGDWKVQPSDADVEAVRRAFRSLQRRGLVTLDTRYYPWCYTRRWHKREQRWKSVGVGRRLVEATITPAGHAELSKRGAVAQMSNDTTHRCEP